MRATEIRNILSIYDNDELNVACYAEEHEELQEVIARKICEVLNLPRLYGHIVKFDSIKEILKSFGFEYVRPDETDESYYFFNKETKDEIDLYPVWFYSEPETIRLQNFILS